MPSKVIAFENFVEPFQLHTDSKLISLNIGDNQSSFFKEIVFLNKIGLLKICGLKNKGYSNN